MEEGLKISAVVLVIIAMMLLFIWRIEVYLGKDCANRNKVESLILPKFKLCKK